MRHGGAILGACAFALGGCYLAHERGGDDGGGSDASRCALGAPAVVRLEPPMAGDVTDVSVLLLGASPDPASNGVRVHLLAAACGTMASCALDLVVTNVGNPLADLVVADSGARGTLTMRGGAAALHAVDERACVACGGELDLLAGALRSGVADTIATSAGAALCTDSCGDTRALTVEVHGASLVTSAGPEVDAPPLRVRLASDYTERCVRCRCDEAPLEATGLVVFARGSFTR